jgi:translation initiation factor 1
MVTLIEGFQASDTEKAEIVKQLKTFCGTGGSYKDAEMIIQGDHREKITAWLNKKGYTNVKQK